MSTTTDETSAPPASSWSRVTWYGRDSLEPGRWWRVIAPDGYVLCETSDEDEARASLLPGYRLERQWRAEVSEWREVAS